LGVRVNLDDTEKNVAPPLPPGFEPWTVQPISSRYTDYMFKDYEEINTEVYHVDEIL
jgi:hypothetical protein